MLIVAHSLRELDFDQLMAVYDQSNWENGAAWFPGQSQERQRLQTEQGFGDYLREDFFRQKGAFYGILAEQGMYVSALRLEPYEDGMLLEALETRPDQRQKGYAKALMAQALALLPTGTKVYSHVSKRNKASLNVHYACGFRLFRDYAVELDGTVTRNAVTLRKE